MDLKSYLEELSAVGSDEHFELSLLCILCHGYKDMDADVSRRPESIQVSHVPTVHVPPCFCTTLLTGLQYWESGAKLGGYEWYV